MRKILKLLFILIGIIVVVFAGAAVALVAFVDPNDFKPTLTEQVKEATGRELVIDGDLELSIFPWLGIKTGALTLGNPAGFKEPAFAHIKSAEARAKLLPLFSGDLEMDTVSLKGLELNLVRLRNGKDNWSDLAGKKTTTDKADKTEEKPDSAEAVAALAIGGVDIENASITWDDRQSGERIDLASLNLQTGELELGAPMSFSMNGNIKRKSDGMNGSFKASTTLRMNPFEGSYSASGLNLSMNLKGKGLPGQQLDAALRADVAADLIRQTLSLTNLEVSALTLQANGKLNASNIFKTPSYKGELGLKQFNPRTLMALMGTKVDLADPKALSSAKFDISFDGNNNRINLSKLSGKLDDTSLNGKLAITNLNSMAMNFDLALDRIDLDRYRGTAPAGQPAKAATPATAAAASAPVLPVELLRGLNINGKARINSLRVAQIDVTDISMTTRANNGDIHLYPIKAKVSGGTYDGNIGINVKGSQPLISVNEKLANVETGPLVQTFSGYDAITGKGNIVAKMTTRGNTDNALRQNLNGTLSFNVNNGLIKGINIDHQLRSAYSVIKGKPIPSDNGVKDTVFSSLKANATVTNGVLVNRDLNIYTDNLRINGDGKVNLVRETINYRLGANVIKSYDGPDSKEFNELKRLTVPIIIKGSLNKPSINVDLERLLTEKAKQKLEKKLMDSILGKPKKTEPAPGSQQPAEQPQQEEKKSKEDEVKDLLKGLFK